LLSLPSACASLAGLDDGTSKDAASHPAPRDASLDHDARAAHTDASVDATVDGDATNALDAMDATVAMDGGDATGAHDAGKEGDAIEDARPDASTEAGAQKDARLEAECTPVALPDAAPPPACHPQDAGGCLPASLSGFVPRTVPAAAPQAACTTAQVQNLIASCFAPATATDSACESIFDSAAEQPCNSCMLTPSTAAAWGPLVFFAAYGVYVPNIGGCIQLVAPCQTACAAAFEADEECQLAACGSTCPGSVSQSDYVACVTEAVGCGCYDYENPAAVCGNELLIGPPAMCVLDTTNLEAVALSFGNLFCVGAVDAGPDAAPPHDAAGHG
jgi:hypothetical protein